MNHDTETVATAAVRSAEATLHRQSLSDPRLAPPLDLRLLPAPALGAAARGAPTLRKGGPARPVDLPTRAPTLRSARAQLEEGTVTTRELVEAAINVADKVAALGAVVALDEKEARHEADTLDAERAAGRCRGPLHGIPLTVKDVIDVSGLPTRAGSAAYDDRPSRDATAVARLRRAGALVLAKVATHEFALGVATPQCANPLDASRISGGSSGGSAIAVATGIGLASLGTDTRASLRVPAALCGVVGFKPTFGSVPADGIVPLSWTVDHLGPVARDVADAAVMLEVLTGLPLGSGAHRGTEPIRIGVCEEVLADAEAEVGEACEAALRALEAGGCRLVAIDVPGIPELELANDIGLLITRSEAAAYHRAQRTDLSRCLPEVRDQLEAASTIAAVDYLDAQRQRLVLAERAEAAFAECDIVATPTTPIVAPRREEYERHLLRLSRNTIVWSLTGCPALSMPAGADSSGLAIGLQLAARPGEEATLVEAAMTLEAELGRR